MLFIVRKGGLANSRNSCNRITITQLGTHSYSALSCINIGSKLTTTYVCMYVCMYVPHYTPTPRNVI